MPKPIVAAFAALLAAAPGAAQIVGNADAGPPPARDLFFDSGYSLGPPGPGPLRSLRRQIDRARADGTLSRREARRMRRALRRAAAMPGAAAPARETSVQLVRADLDRARRERDAGGN